MGERTEGWGNLDNAQKAHYFRGKRSLCGKWMTFGVPYWESNQKKGDAPDRGTCMPCWKKAPDEAPA